MSDLSAAADDLGAARKKLAEPHEIADFLLKMASILLKVADPLLRLGITAVIPSPLQTNVLELEDVLKQKGQDAIAGKQFEIAQSDLKPALDLIHTEVTESLAPKLGALGTTAINSAIDEAASGALTPIPKT